MQSSHPWICDSRARNIWDTQVSQSSDADYGSGPPKAILTRRFVPSDQCDLFLLLLVTFPLTD
jgi:hypothetical protein